MAAASAVSGLGRKTVPDEKGIETRAYAGWSGCAKYVARPSLMRRGEQKRKPIGLNLRDFSFNLRVTNALN